MPHDFASFSFARGVLDFPRVSQFCFADFNLARVWFQSAAPKFYLRKLIEHRIYKYINIYIYIYTAYRVTTVKTKVTCLLVCWLTGCLISCMLVCVFVQCPFRFILVALGSLLDSHWKWYATFPNSFGVYSPANTFFSARIYNACSSRGILWIVPRTHAELCSWSRSNFSRQCCGPHLV